MGNQWCVVLLLEQCICCMLLGKLHLWWWLNSSRDWHPCRVATSIQLFGKHAHTVRFGKKKLFPYRRKTWYIPSGNPAQDIHGKSLCLIGKSGKSSTNGGFSIAMSAVLVAAQPEQHLAFPDSADWISRVWKRFPCLRLGNLRTWEANQLSQPTLTISINYETIVITKI